MFVAFCLFAPSADALLRQVINVSESISRLTRVLGSISSRYRFMASSSISSVTELSCLDSLLSLSLPVQALLNTSKIIQKNNFSLLEICSAARLADSAVHKKDVGVCTLTYPTFRPSHCQPTRISNVASPRLGYTYKTPRQSMMSEYTPTMDVPVAVSACWYKVAKFERSR